MEQMFRVSSNKNNRHQTIVPTQTTVIIITGGVTTQENHLKETKEPNNQRNQGQKHSEGQENQWKLIEGKHSVIFAESSVTCKRIVEGNWDYV